MTDEQLVDVSDAIPAQLTGLDADLAAELAALGPGTWLLDAGHFPRPLCAFAAAVFPAPAMRGFATTFARYGALLECLDFSLVGRFVYNRLRPVGAPPDAVGHPPREVFEQILAVSPQLQERIATADAALAERRWRADLAAWDETTKPRLIALRDELDRVPLAGLSDEDLAAHVARCREAYVEGVYQHHYHNSPALLPVGDFVLHGMAWTGRPPGELLACLSGSSRVSKGGGAELDDLAAAIAGDEQARSLVADASADPAAVFTALAEAAGAVGDTARAYRDVIRFLPVDGEDAIGERGSLEALDLVVSRIRGAVAADEAAESQPDADAAAAAARALVPEDARSEFDELLADARLVYRLRDERSVYGERGMGCVTRRALLAAGRRLASRGLLDATDHVVDLTPDEVASLLGAGVGPSAAEVAHRVRWRLTADYRRLPPVVGPPPGEPLPAAWLPPAAARVHAAMGFAVSAVLGDAPPQEAAGTVAVAVRGLGASEGVREGRARVILSTDDLDRVEQGDVLVTTSTGPAFNLVLPLLAGIVTDRGGLLSHAAIVAREFCVPAVVGCRDATRLIADGARIRVDGTAGAVSVL